VEGSNSVPGLAALSIVVEFINDRAPTVSVDTMTRSGRAELSADAPVGSFVAHVSASDVNRGDGGRVTCRLDDGHDDQLRLVRMFEGELLLAAVIIRQMAPLCFPKAIRINYED